MGKNIGIKLADGTFYPIMEEGIPKKKLLELTTVQDNQTTVMVDLYRSESGTMSDAEYVDTLQISDLVPHGNGEPNICLTLQLDEDNNLSADVYDPESGTSSSSNVQLVTRAEAQRNETPDYTITEPDIETASDMDVTIDDENAFADDAFPAEFADSISEEQAEALMEEATEEDSVENEDVETQPESILQDIPESNPEEELGIGNEFDTEETTPVLQEDFSDEMDSGDIATDLALGAAAGLAVASLVDDNDMEENKTDNIPDSSEELPADDISDTNLRHEDFSQETVTDFSDLPDFDDNLDFQATQETDSLPEFDDSSVFSVDDSLSLVEEEPNYEIDSIDNDYVHESALPDFSKFELPDFDDPVQNAGFAVSSGLFNESDFDDPAFQSQDSQNPPEFGFSDLYDSSDDNDFDYTEKKTRNTASVVTCVICAIICIVAAALVLFFLFPRTGDNLIEVAKKESVQEVLSVKEEPEVVVSTELPELPPQPEPKEDVIVISETPAVVPIPPPAPEKKPEPVQYKIRWGDTLWDLADSFYNNPWLYKKIASANNIKNPDRIVSGTYIMIPPK